MLSRAITSSRIIAAFTGVPDGTKFLADDGTLKAPSSLSGLTTGALQYASSATALAASPFFREDANTIAQRNGTNSQTLNMYKTYTDASNYERLAIYSFASGFVIGPETAGTGTDNLPLRLHGAGAAGVYVYGNSEGLLVSESTTIGGYYLQLRAGNGYGNIRTYDNNQNIEMSAGRDRGGGILNLNAFGNTTGFLLAGGGESMGYVNSPAGASYVRGALAKTSGTGVNRDGGDLVLSAGYGTAMTDPHGEIVFEVGSLVADRAYVQAGRITSNDGADALGWYVRHNGAVKQVKLEVASGGKRVLYVDA